MPAVQLTVTVEVDGQKVPDLSFIRRLVVDSVYPLDQLMPDNAGSQAIRSLQDLVTLQALILRASDQSLVLNVTASGQGVPATIPISPGGIVICFDIGIPVSGGTAETIGVTQNSGQSSQVAGLVAGEAA